ncbi:MAG TPA: DinB family protein [Pyrinomonadaceae bacterium]|jgi:hypothetical protein|nr:DinB family protein [Pyrinomonadaceae bacterium]
MRKLQNVIDDWRRTIDESYRALGAISDAEAGAHTHGPEKWSTKQVLGHLIDSAANNHQRFVRLLEASDLSLPKYAQEHWVRSQGYQDEPWPELLNLWRAYNHHLAHVAARVPEEMLGHTCRVGDDEPVTLQFLIEDYVDHLKNHLATIPDLQPRVGR